MRIQFEVAGYLVEFRRNWFTGSVVLQLAGVNIPLQSVWDLTTHFSLRLTHVWQGKIEGHDVVIEKVRPLLLAGFRQHSYRVFIDDQVVAESYGY